MICFLTCEFGDLICIHDKENSLSILVASGEIQDWESLSGTDEVSGDFSESGFIVLTGLWSNEFAPSDYCCISFSFDLFGLVTSVVSPCFISRVLLYVTF